MLSGPKSIEIRCLDLEGEIFGTDRQTDQEDIHVMHFMC